MLYHDTGTSPKHKFPVYTLHHRRLKPGEKDSSTKIIRTSWISIYQAHVHSDRGISCHLLRGGRIPPQGRDADRERVCCLRSAELNRCSDVDGIPCRTGRVILERGTPLQVINEEHDSYVPSSIPEWSNATSRCSRYGA